MIVANIGIKSGCNFQSTRSVHAVDDLYKTVLGKYKGGYD